MLVTELCIVAFIITFKTKKGNKTYILLEIWNRLWKSDNKKIIKWAHACKSTRFQWVEGAVRTGEMRGWGRVWGRWEKTGGGGGIVRHLLVTATLGNCTMHLTLHQNDCTRVCLQFGEENEWMCFILSETITTIVGRLFSCITIPPLRVLSYL